MCLNNMRGGGRKRKVLHGTGDTASGLFYIILSVFHPGFELKRGGGGGGGGN